MIVDKAWVVRNLGLDPSTTQPSISTFVGASNKASTNEDLQREIIDFDSESPAGLAFLAITTATSLSRFTEIPWPGKLAPKTGPAPSGSGSGPLPRADVLVVTWTVDEGHALSRVLTPGKDSRSDYRSYTHNYVSFAKKMHSASPAVDAKRLGAFWTTTIGEKKVVVFKSDSHLSQDTRMLPKASATLPIKDVWEQIIWEVQPQLVITTGTAEGIGKDCEVGDVIVSPIVLFNCLTWLKRESFHGTAYQEGAPKTRHLAIAKRLFKANAGHLPKDKTRPPRIVLSRTITSSVLTTDFFSFDTSNNHHGLQGLGTVSEMGDAVLGLVASEMGARAPRRVAVRNVSYPQIKAEGTLQQQAQIAVLIYKAFGRWSSVCSAIVCWALIAAEK